MSLSATLQPPPVESRRKPVCQHCGAPSPAGVEFCCAGCAYVYRLIHDEGLDDYYKFRDDITAPADAALQPERDFAWLADLQHLAETRAADRTPEIVLAVQGISCAACVWLIDRVFQKQPGAGRCEVNAQTGRLRLLWRDGFDAPAFARALQRFNYLVGPVTDANDTPSESRALAKRVGLAAAFAMNVMLFALPTYFGMAEDFAYARLFSTLAMGFATLSLLAGGGYFLGKAWRALQIGAMHVDLPIALGICGAYAGSFYGWISGREEYVYFDFVSGFILLMLIGRWAQVAAVERNQRRLLRLQPTPPRVGVVGRDGAICLRSPDTLRPGDAFVVGAGETVPVAAKLTSAEAGMNLAWINGESEPRVFRADQRVPAGAQNAGREEIRLRAVEGWAGSLLAELLKPVERAEQHDSLVARVVQVYLIAIIATAILAGVGWLWLTGDGLHAGAVVTAVLVVSCPCALGLAFPLADEMATVALRRRGVFVRAGDLWPRLAKLRRVVFDKTGTLTLETPQLGNPEILKTLRSEAIGALRALVEDNLHPAARALHEAILVAGLDGPCPAGEVRETIGRGVELGLWSLGRAGWKTRAGGSAAGDLVLGWGGEEVAAFSLSEAARADAAAEIAALRRRRLDVSILSGDRPEKVGALAAGLGLGAEAALGGLSPREKADWIDAAGAEATLMLGDGANDSLAFDRAGCRGTPVVHRGVLAEKADFYYLGRGIDGIRALLEVNDARRATHLVLLVFMIAYNLTAVGLAVSGHMSPLFAAVLMPLSSLATLAIVGIGLRKTLRRA